jgi:hypothetical protein
VAALVSYFIIICVPESLRYSSPSELTAAPDTAVFGLFQTPLPKDASTRAVAFSSTTAVGANVGSNDGINVGVSVGIAVGIFVGISVGISVGVIVGMNVGIKVGIEVGVKVGVIVGTIVVGILVGLAVGISVGALVGLLVGENVGLVVGVNVGVVVGLTVGMDVGFAVGVLVGVIVVGVTVGLFVTDVTFLIRFLSDSEIYKLYELSKRQNNGPLIIAEVAAPPSPNDVAVLAPVPTTVEIKPVEISTLRIRLFL